VLEAQVIAFNRVAEEMNQMSQWIDAMQDQVFWFTGALENILGWISLDDRLQLVPEPRCIGEASEVGPTLVDRSTSPSTPLSVPIPMDEDKTHSVRLIVAPKTHTTDSESPLDFRMAEVGPTLANLDLAKPMPTEPAPTINLTLATPQGSQEVQAADSAPTMEEMPPPIAQKSSRTPGDMTRLGHTDWPNTRSQSHSKTPYGIFILFYSSEQ
jgi:hypothetical protein